jgi:hypothetical protein
MSEAIHSLPLSRVIELAQQSQEARVWTPVMDEDGNPSVPSDEREVLVFLNGHVESTDDEGREGGGWGIRLGWFDHDKHFWYAGGKRGEPHVTHWMDLPGPPQREESTDE